jgi:hypothetical protein
MENACASSIKALLALVFIWVPTSQFVRTIDISLLTPIVGPDGKLSSSLLGLPDGVVGFVFVDTADNGYTGRVAILYPLAGFYPLKNLRTWR